MVVEDAELRARAGTLVGLAELPETARCVHPAFFEAAPDFGLGTAPPARGGNDAGLGAARV